ncbi:MAG TPA: acetoin utilization protein AcuC [Candidatus Lokiarchaeia archaeon]|nr:acetoin utilization protein AcuC [Candidatus Lokiarchaeia archaeon]
MPQEVGLIYSKEFSKYSFGKEHPLRPIRVELTYSLMKQYGLLENESLAIIPPRMATDEELARVHSRDYIEIIRKYSVLGSYSGMSREPFMYGLGPGDNPIFKGMYEASALVAGASVVAAEQVMDETTGIHYCFNPAGGLHHALKSKASGFCIFNDIAVAIAHIKANYPGTKVMYIDIDVHHGDGVQWIFYDDPDVLTVDFHESGEFLFPGTGFTSEMGKGDAEGFKVNFPLLPRFYDDVYLNLFTRTVPDLAKAFQPDVIVSQLGVDTHFEDPLAGLGLDTSGQERVCREIHKVAKNYAHDRWVPVGGGGYLMTVVPRSWTMFLAEMLGVKLPNKIPEEWVEEAHAQVTDEETPTELRDINYSMESMLLRNPDFITERELYADKLVNWVHETILPLIEARKS